MLWSRAIRGWPHEASRYRHRPWSGRTFTTISPQQDEPLRILFCGTEAFSIASLEALREYQKSPNSNILSIDVATRKDKRVGRGLKELRPPPIKSAAARLGLRVHQFDTFTGWHLPDYLGKDERQPYINLVVTVSFGLLVPPRILNNVKYGGLNVHPSMLPDLRGAAPINWTIMHGYTHTGVTIQTLHPSKFDHGVILAQTRKPGIAIPDPNDITAHELRHLLTPVGAEMLVNTIRDKSYLQPHKELTPSQSDPSTSQYLLAPKITTSMKTLDPFKDSLTSVLRKHRAIPRLWAEATVDTEEGQQKKRIIFGIHLRAASMEDLPRDKTQDIIDEIKVGIPFALVSPDQDVHQCEHPLHLKFEDGAILTVPTLLVAGDRERPAAAAAAHAKLFAEPFSKGSYEVYQFQQPISIPQTEDYGIEKPRVSPESNIIR